ncbi:Permease of the drug/metabolite transporter (DMT) superfamily [Rhodovulum sp. ES.010]|uniref:DMT family transporter n=1 Tax=Rhodovulum sp. ES.010 TaxID=1882821 RepID=UPI000929CFA5|nr:DMT family transporter [Rhodovulum sp. ES.010]SIO23898.1 Permease of the drug/metabolite transporter (DMT) superfamily [Rhodovulum sp. ES.010]
MERKQSIDAFGATALVAFSALLGFNQVVIKVVNEGLQPVFWAGLRSAGAALVLALWMTARGRPPRILPGTLWAGLLIGAVFSVEFVFLFLALDLTTVTRSSVIFYSMPVWLALAGHVLLPGERITPRKAAGLALAFAGVAWAIVDRGGPGGEASLAGDLCALGAAVAWAGIALCARATPLNRVAPEMQLFWQVAVSAPVLLALSPLFGPFLRDLAPVHLWGLGFQTVVIVSFGFVAWLWLLARYPAAGVASFSFLTPVFGVGLGWALLGERVGPAILGSLALVAAGLVLINRPRRGQVPQKV